MVYGLALEACGLKRVLSQVGVEPSGEAFNSISLDPQTGRPLNPMINAGAIATTSLVPGNTPEERRQALLEFLGDSAGHPLEMDEAIYQSERDTGHRNRAIAHLLRNSEILEGNPEEPLDLYFRQCSVAVTCRDLAVMAATLARGGINPITGRRVLQSQNTGRLLSIMSSCGMYDYAGEWIYNIGMPAKSGVAGGILAVLPGQLGVGVFSPPLDAKGNSVRGIRVCNDLSNDFGLHLFNTPRVITPALKTVRTGADVRSKRLRPKQELELLRQHRHTIRIYQLRGRLIFATLEPVMRLVLEDASKGSCALLDLSQVVDLDRAACRLLLELREVLMRQGVRVFLTGVARPCKNSSSPVWTKAAGARSVSTTCWKTRWKPANARSCAPWLRPSPSIGSYSWRIRNSAGASRPRNWRPYRPDSRRSTNPSAPRSWWRVRQQKTCTSSFVEKSGYFSNPMTDRSNCLAAWGQA